MAPKCYNNTEYCYIARKLCGKGARSSAKEKCPKCSTEIGYYYALLVHIEKFHPSDVKHKPILKSATQIEETFTNHADEFAMFNEDYETVNENLFLPQANNLPSTDSSTLNELKDNLFFQVVVCLVLY